MLRSGTDHTRIRQGGFVLVVVMMVMIVLSFIAILGINRVNEGTRLWGGHRRDTQTYYIAEAGIYRAAAELSSDINWVAGYANQAFTRGTFSVTVYPGVNGPLPNEVCPANRICLESIGQLNGFPNIQTRLWAVGLRVGIPPGITQYAVFSKDAMTLDGTMAINGGNVYSGGLLTISASDVVVGGNVSSPVGVEFASGNANIRGGSVLTNGDVDLTLNDGQPRVIDGSVYAGGSVNGVPGYTNQVTGGGVYQEAQYSDLVEPVSVYEAEFYIDDTMYAGMVADPATTELDSSYLSSGGKKSGMDTYSLSGGNFGGVIHVPGNLDISGNFTGDGLFLIDGNLTTDGNVSVANSSFSFIVRGETTMTGQGGGAFDGWVYSEGDFTAKGNSTINGGVTVWGNLSGGGTFTINYNLPNDTGTGTPGADRYKVIALHKL